MKSGDTRKTVRNIAECLENGEVEGIPYVSASLRGTIAELRRQATTQSAAVCGDIASKLRKFPSAWVSRPAHAQHPHVQAAAVGETFGV
jgi:hypothetical protein